MYTIESKELYFSVHGTQVLYLHLNSVYSQRLKAAVHYTTGLFCQEVAEHKEVEFSKQTIAAIAETTFRQCGEFSLPP